MSHTDLDVSFNREINHRLRAKKLLRELRARVDEQQAKDPRPGRHRKPESDIEKRLKEALKEDLHLVFGALAVAVMFLAPIWLLGIYG